MRGGTAMRNFTLLTILVMSCHLCYGYGVGDVTIKLNGGADVVYSGRVNTLEVWISNEAGSPRSCLFRSAPVSGIAPRESRHRGIVEEARCWIALMPCGWHESVSEPFCTTNGQMTTSAAHDSNPHISKRFFSTSPECWATLAHVL